MNEITFLGRLANKSTNNLLALSTKGAFLLDRASNYTHVWEISRPFSRTYSAQKHSSLSSFGTYTGDDSVDYLVCVVGTNTYKFSTNNGITWSGISRITSDSQELSNGVQIRFYETEGFEPGDSWVISVRRSAFFDDGLWRRWAVTPYDDGFFFTNRLNEIRYIKDQTMLNLGRAAYGMPKGTYLETFYQHLIVGAPVINGQHLSDHILISDLHDFTQWETRLSTNEADRYKLEIDNQTPEVQFGVTGVKRLGQDCIIYTGSSVEKMNYVGLPNVMRKDSITDKIGCAFPYGLVGNNKLHVFPSFDNFYTYNGIDYPTPIGDPIWPYFRQTLSRDPIARYKVWGSIDQERNEVWWTYVSVDSVDGRFDRKVGYNYKNKKWYAASANNEQCFMHTVFLSGAPTIDESTAIIDTADTIIDVASQPTDRTVVRLYGIDDHKIIRECDDSETPDYPQDEPYLETADMYYDLERITHIDGIVIHGGFDASSCDGIQVQVSARKCIDDPVNWQVVAKLWKASDRDTAFSWPKVYGRIFRFRFIFKAKPGQMVTGTKGVIFSAWGEKVYVEQGKEKDER